MTNPTGYTALDLIGYTDRGQYNAASNYVKNDLVHYNGDVWRVLIDDTTGVTPTEGVNYTIFVEAPNNAVASSIAPIEQATATEAHATGTQFYYNDVLYTATADIAVGDTLTVGTNIEASDDITTQISNVVQQSAFTVLESGGIWYLVWHGANTVCPYSVEQSGTDFNLIFSYT